MKNYPSKLILLSSLLALSGSLAVPALRADDQASTAPASASDVKPAADADSSAPSSDAPEAAKKKKKGKKHKKKVKEDDSSDAGAPAAAPATAGS